MTNAIMPAFTCKAVTSTILKTPAGYVRASPWLTISSKQVELIARFMAEPGLTPASRLRLVLPVPSGPELWEM